MKKGKKGIIAGAAVLIIALLLLAPKLFSSKSKQTENQTAGRSLNAPIMARVTVISPRTIENKVNSSGTILGNEEVDLRSETSGKITHILFTEGTRVNQGDLLVKINDSELQAQLKKAVYNRDLAKDKEFRQRALLEKQGTSKEAYDMVLNELNSANADIELIKAQIDKTEIRAPFGGVVGLRSVSVGSYITPNTPIVSMQSNNPVKIDFSIPEKYYGYIKSNSNISFKIQNSSKTYNAKIYAIEPKIDPSTRTIKARAIANNDDRSLFPGSFTEIEVVLNNIKDAIMIPSEALIPDIEGEKVYVLKNGKAAAQRVSSGIRTEKELQIIDGLAKGDSLIVSGIMQLRPGAPVKAVN